MKNYFYKIDMSIDILSTEQQTLFDENTILKYGYNKADEIYEERFDKIEKGEKSSGKKVINKRINQLKSLLKDINVISAKKDRSQLWQSAMPIDKLSNLTLGNIYLHLVQCYDEIFLPSKKYYQKAVEYLWTNFTLDKTENIDDIDCLFLLNQGKYFRNIARHNKKSDYIKSYNIFEDVRKKIEQIECDEENNTMKPIKKQKIYSNICQNTETALQRSIYSNVIY